MQHLSIATARRGSRAVPLALALLLAGPARVSAQQGDKDQPPNYTIYGFAMTDFGFAKVANNPQWYDVSRPSRLPSFDKQYGADNNFFASVRQTRFGVKADFPTAIGRLKTIFEFDMFGVGADAGQTTIRPRHFYGELGQFGAGQTNSPFMDIDVFPNTVEYWGPNGMLFLRNPQLRWIPMQGNKELMFALEKPGGSADAGDYAERIELQNVRPRFSAPDVSGSFKVTTGWGHVKFGAILRAFKIDDLNDDNIDLNHSITAGGGTISTVVNFNEKKDAVRLQATYGSGIQNYFNDAPFDVGAEENPGNATRPIEAKPLPIVGATAYLDHSWNDRFSSSIGYSFVDIDNTTGQPANAYKHGDYASANLLFYPAKNVMAGGELLWARRENYSDGFTVDDVRFQFSVKYNFSFTPSIPSSASRSSHPALAGEYSRR